MALLISLKDHKITEILVGMVAEFLTERVRKFINNKLMIWNGASPETLKLVGCIPD